MSLEDFKNRVLPVKNKLFRFALRIVGNTEDAEDIVQDVLIKVWDKRVEMHKFLNMEAWCMKLVKNQSLDRIKSGQFKAYLNKEEQDVQSEEHTPHGQSELRDTIKIVHNCISSLPEKQKQVIQLRDVEGYSYQEISEIMEIDMNQVKVNLFRARKTIKERILKQETYGT
jgi:RNA polymerase sigma-70 factor (ECF subfamily)